jgi:hypothetical protein
VTETREYNGQKYYDLTVKAEDIKQVMPGVVTPNRTIGSTETAPAPFPLEDAPF